MTDFEAECNKYHLLMLRKNKQTAFYLCIVILQLPNVLILSKLINTTTFASAKDYWVKLFQRTKLKLFKKWICFLCPEVF